MNTTGKTPDFKGDGNPESTAASLKNVAVGQKVLFVRARESKKSIQQLLANKLTVLELIVYKNVPKNDIQKSDADILFFTSAMNAEAYLKKYMAEKHQDAYSMEIKSNLKLEVEDIISQNPTEISWTRALRNDLKKGISHVNGSENYRIGMYRPFTKQKLYFDKSFIESPGLSMQLFPTKTTQNLLIAVSGIGQQKEFAPFITNSITDLHVVDKGQCFPLYYYEENNAT